MSCQNSPALKVKSLFNGTDFSGWEGDTLTIWRVEDKTIVGGSLNNTVAHNYFLCTIDTYDDFILKLKIKLTGDEGFINYGIQFRSRRMNDPDYEMVGYQADFGEAYWVSLYDESRRNKTLIAPDAVKVLEWVNSNDWNDYEIRAEGRRIRLFINGHQSVDYTEDDLNIPQYGLIGIQIHGGGKAQVYVKDITIQELK
ncbi:DUF1080 domain-containing protein [Maribacter litopenaei]|uniref:DUF1080 domain-containing protein n=1 Tax=Maribacter litopenaei TaxID=2976127 RepID=A0ABY5Y9Y8_9FLAO|nr:DUF1080 domain-containing protein [Maribacter litopenaei]UWX55837.1 DUF1080 domain-containing protein [Maribacter litopenaei]